MSFYENALEIIKADNRFTFTKTTNGTYQINLRLREMSNSHGNMKDTQIVDALYELRAKLKGAGVTEEQARVSLSVKHPTLKDAKGEDVYTPWPCIWLDESPRVAATAASSEKAVENLRSEFNSKIDGLTQLLTSFLSTQGAAAPAVKPRDAGTEAPAESVGL